MGAERVPDAENPFTGRLKHLKIKDVAYYPPPAKKGWLERLIGR